MTGPAPLPIDGVAFFHSRFKALGSPSRAAGERSYLKSSLNFHGVGVPGIRRACVEFRKLHPDLDRTVLHALAVSLFETDWHELRSAAIGVLELHQGRLSRADLPWLIDLVRHSGNWAHVDWLATKVIGPIVDRMPNTERGRMLRAWARDHDLWVRRTAVLAQLGSLRSGTGDFGLFSQIAASMLNEKEFFIRKAIGWVLRDVSKRTPELVVEFLCEHVARVSKLTLREATKHMPPAMRERVR